MVMFNLKTLADDEQNTTININNTIYVLTHIQEKALQRRLPTFRAKATFL